ncbi:MAG: DNA replication/repair protein RecF [Hyphomonadaceae bacterium]|nr:DNA replication/repair protein RecF [Hyphomonadaceae bacterium]
MPLNAVSRADGTVSSSAERVELRAWVARLRLTNFRNYTHLALAAGPEPMVLTGPNGAGKTNLLEAVSLLTAGQGLRRSPFPELAHVGSTAWAVAATLQTPLGPVDIGTGLKSEGSGARTGRIVRIDGEDQSGSGVLASHASIFWLIPAMDGLFTGPASERRRFLDRLIPSFDPGYRPRLGQFERAMQQRNRLLAEDVRDPARFAGFEHVMAETGVAIAAARAAAVAELAAAIGARRDAASASAFPWAELAIAGTLERALATQPAVDVEDAYLASLQMTRDRDRAAGRTLEGPHRSDLIVGHGPKQMPASVCSTGEQKALLIGLVLAHADLVRQRRDGAAPILLLDEIAAHLDPVRRAALFEDIVALGSQAWLTGTDPEAFSALENRARFHHVEDGRVTIVG